jgi:hypothetical protein
MFIDNRGSAVTSLHESDHQKVRLICEMEIGIDARRWNSYLVFMLGDGHAGSGPAEMRSVEQVEEFEFQDFERAMI